MKTLFAVGAFVALLGVPGADRASAPPAVSVNTSGSDYYTNVSGHRVHRPMAAAVKPPGATAQCRDRTYSFSEHRRGTCSRHGGVATWLSP